MSIFPRNKSKIIFILGCIGIIQMAAAFYINNVIAGMSAGWVLGLMYSMIIYRDHRKQLKCKDPVFEETLDDLLYVFALENEVNIDETAEYLKADYELRKGQKNEKLPN
jgi:hypothetical protein